MSFAIENSEFCNKAFNIFATAERYYYLEGVLKNDDILCGHMEEVLPYLSTECRNPLQRAETLLKHYTMCGQTLHAHYLNELLHGYLDEYQNPLYEPADIVAIYRHYARSDAPVIDPFWFSVKMSPEAEASVSYDMHRTVTLSVLDGVIPVSDETVFKFYSDDNGIQENVHVWRRNDQTPEYMSDSLVTQDPLLFTKKLFINTWFSCRIEPGSSRAMQHRLSSQVDSIPRDDVLIDIIVTAASCFSAMGELEYNEFDQYANMSACTALDLAYVYRQIGEWKQAQTDMGCVGVAMCDDIAQLIESDDLLLPFVQAIIAPI